jgi:Leucine-rich repeat (LRR) protein
MIGEILTSLEYLKMNDSLVRCFRDIGSSFKFVRVLHLARCELKEVQGIQAFEHLEELYLNFNDIDELFDISFLEHLSVLDLEGNNVKNLDQLYYLRRCQKLTDVSLKANPVTHEITYYSKLSENLPKSVQYLDGEAITEGYFEKKTEEAKKFSLVKAMNTRTSLSNPELSTTEKEIIHAFIKAGALQDAQFNVALKWCEDALSSLEKEPCEDEVLIRAIKTFTKEKKANNALGYDSDDEFFDDVNIGDDARSEMNRTKTSGFRETLSMFKKKKPNQDPNAT